MDFFLDRLARHQGLALASPAPTAYPALLDEAARLSATLPLQARDRAVLLAPPGPDAVVGLLAIWMKGATAVPLHPGHPPAEWDHVLRHARPACAVVHERLRPVLDAVAAPREVPLVDVAARSGAPAAPAAWTDAQTALMLYTSGTTSRPKGVPLSAGQLATHIQGLTEQWHWSAQDAVYAFLPLHHVHGLINILACALYAGARVHLREKFDPAAVYAGIADGEVTLIMAVPTIYHRLLAHHDKATPDEQARFSAGAQKLRLWVSGSAALDGPMFDRLLAVTGQPVLERYGMTEIGMALANPYDGPRRRGEVGVPLPWMDVRLRGPDGALVEGDGEGSIEVHGPGVFSGYFENEAATAAAFTDDGWFVTGDVAAREAGRYRILGRTSVDIIKSGGEKISALEIEAVLLGHPEVSECAVVGLPDAQWGQIVAAAVVAADRGDAETLRERLPPFAKETLAPAKVPKVVRVVDALPRNAMGKVQKPAVQKLFEDHDG